jgi:hypothetical protein
MVAIDRQDNPLSLLQGNAIAKKNPSPRGRKDKLKQLSAQLNVMGTL